MTTKFALPAALASLLFAGAASAVNLNPAGVGQVLIYPYYTVNRNQDTLISLSNIQDTGKAVLVRFREGYNGRAAMDFTLFLAPHDSWSAAISLASSDGGAQIASADESCVDDVILPWPRKFTSVDYTGGATGYSKDSGPQGIERTREGMIEVIALGDIKPGSATDLAIRPPAAGGKPTCAVPQLFDGDLTTAGNGLVGSGAVINASQGTYYAYNADALANFAAAPLLNPTAQIPDLASAGSADSLFPGGAIASVTDGSGESMRLHYARGIDAVSAVFMADALHNDFLRAPGIGANTDWIVTFPTKQFYVDQQRYPSSFGVAPFASAFLNGKSPVEAVTYQLHESDGNNWWQDAFPQACASATSGNCPRARASLDWQVNALAFLPDMRPETSTDSGVFGSRVATPPYLASGQDTGWFTPDSGTLTLQFGSSEANRPRLTEARTADGRTVRLPGLPVSGFMAYNIINANAAPGMLANYGGTFRHRRMLRCQFDAEGPGSAAPCP